MPKGTRDQLPPLQQLVHGKKLPILVLDERWYKLFPGGVKPEEVKTLEKKCNELLKEQGKLVNEIKDLRRGKKKLMDAIVSGMNEAENDRKKEKQKKLLIETKQKIEEESDRLMEIGERLAKEYNIPYLPSDFKKKNGWINAAATLSFRLTSFFCFSFHLLSASSTKILTSTDFPIRTPALPVFCVFHCAVVLAACKVGVIVCHNVPISRLISSAADNIFLLMLFSPTHYIS